MPATALSSAEQNPAEKPPLTEEKVRTFSGVYSRFGLSPCLLSNLIGTLNKGKRGKEESSRGEKEKNRSAKKGFPRLVLCGRCDAFGESDARTHRGHCLTQTNFYIQLAKVQRLACGPFCPPQPAKVQRLAGVS